MKTPKIPVLAAAIFFCLLSAVAGAQTFSVQVKEAQVREKPSFLGKVVGRLNYADRVPVDMAQGPWKHVDSPHAKGWLHESALTAKTIVLKAGDKNAALAASTSEVALAGKGFNRQVETEFRSRNPKMDFTWVDRMEAITVSAREMAQFADQGDLRPQGGEK